MTLFRMTGAEVDTLIGTNLRRLREDACLPVPHAAARFRIDPERLAAAEAGGHLTCPELLAVIRCLHVGFDALFEAPASRVPS